MEVSRGQLCLSGQGQGRDFTLKTTSGAWGLLSYEGELKELALLLYGPSKLTSSPKHVLPQTTFPTSGEERLG